MLALGLANELLGAPLSALPALGMLMCACAYGGKKPILCIVSPVLTVFY